MAPQRGPRMISGMRVRRRSSAGGKKSYRFYRLYVTEVNEQNSVAVRTLALIDKDEVDVAPSRFIAATASSSGALYPPERVVDPSGYWWSGDSSGLPAWVALELRSEEHTSEL